MNRFSSVLYKAAIAAMLAVTGGVIAFLAMQVFGPKTAPIAQVDTAATVESTATDASVTTTTVPTASYTPVMYVNPLEIELLENGYYFDQLDEPLRKQYNSMLMQIVASADDECYTDDGEYGESISLFGYTHDEASVEELLHAVYRDHPELFFLTSKYAYRSLEDGLFVDVYYSMSAAERKAALPKLNAAVDELLQQCVGDDEYETELQLHDALLRRCSYNEEAANLVFANDLHWDMSSPYAALCEGEAICGGYARAMQLLLERAGISATLAYNDDHVWNKVRIDWEVYNLDPTWNDFDDAIVSHSYFNVTDRDVAASRKLPREFMELPAATKTSDAYYHREGYYIDDLYDYSLSAAIEEQLSYGSDRLELRFDYTIFEEALDYIESDIFFYEFSFLDDTPYEGLWDSFVYYPDPNTGVVDFLATGYE